MLSEPASKRSGRVPPPQLAEAKAQGLYNIGEAAHATGITSKMIRHYESIGLIAAAGRTTANYRVYRESDLHQLRFIKRARGLGFSIKQIEQLLSLWRDGGRGSVEVKQLALAHVQEIDERIRQLQTMRDAVAELAQCCQGDSRPDCPIIDALAARA